ncbi:MAG TPA: lysine--tRNA ligase [Candidatus Omnitrophota bacterium]|nr:lysine--tRNA ligase [Candidatus Omnitrophota bacterium]
MEENEETERHNFEAKEKFFWADEVADEIIKKKGKKKEYVCASGITPSGTVHMGNFREVITTDLVARALKDKGKKVRFIYSWDDYDRLRKIPPNIPKSYEKHLGTPISEIPSPFGKKESYAGHFEKEFEKSLEKVDIKPEFIRQNSMYKKSKYAALIKTALDKNNEIKKILNKYRKEPLEKDWVPLEVYSKKTGKDDTEIIDIKGYKITYRDSTGFQETIDYRKVGNIKLKWRVDWPARWKYEKVDFEPGGIDHSVEGGSYTTAKEIAKKVFGIEPPVYQFYEFVRMKNGSEFSSSEGNALTLDETESVYEPEIIRYIFVKTRPNKAFPISFDNDIIKIYDEYDELENKYYNKELDERDTRIYEMSQVAKITKKKPEKVGFRHLITLIQSGDTKNLNEESKRRAEKVKNWLAKYAGDDMKFSIREKVEIKIDKKQREALVSLREFLGKKNFSEDELNTEIFNICKAVGIEPKEFFEGAYGIIIGRSRGPRLASLILSTGKDKIIKLLEQI